MAEGFKDYVGNACERRPARFGAGFIAMTILANLILALGLYLGWHLNAFTTLQISTVAVCMAALEIVLILPYRLWKSNKAEVAANNAEIACERNCNTSCEEQSLRRRGSQPLPSAILSLPAFVSRSPPDNSCMYPSWISRSLCSAGIARCIKPLAQSCNETNSSWVNGGAGAIPRICAGFPSGRLTSSNVATWVLSNQDSSTAPQTSQDT